MLPCHRLIRSVRLALHQDNTVTSWGWVELDRIAVHTAGGQKRKAAEEKEKSDAKQKKTTAQNKKAADNRMLDKSALERQGRRDAKAQ
jgi:hypothetical protein